MFHRLCNNKQKNTGTPSSTGTTVVKEDSDASFQGSSSEDEYENYKSTRFIKGVASLVTPMNMLVIGGICNGLFVLEDCL